MDIRELYETYFSTVYKFSAEEIEGTVSLEDLSISYIEKEKALSVHRKLHQLKEPYKEVVSLRIFGELSFKEIGEIFGKSENWARVTYHRGKTRIKEELENEDHM